MLKAKAFIDCAREMCEKLLARTGNHFQILINNYSMTPYFVLLSTPKSFEFTNLSKSTAACQASQVQ